MFLEVLHVPQRGRSIAIHLLLLIHFTFLRAETTGGHDNAHRLSDNDFLGLRLIHEPSDHAIDIVAVHGMDGHWSRSWTAANGVFWLEHLLPSAVPKARIYSFSYDSKSRGRKTRSALNILDHSNQLLVELTTARERTGTERTPIIFIGHSLGGLVIKRALVSSSMCRDDSSKRLRAIKLSTAAVLFFGTPHQGGQGVWMLQMMASLTTLFAHSDKKLLEFIKPDSDGLFELQELYNPIQQDFSTISFYETREMSVPFLGHLQVVQKASAVIFGAAHITRVALDADHSTLVKYTGEYDSNFRIVAENIQTLSNSAQMRVSRNWIAVKASEFDKFTVGLTFRPAWNSHFAGRETLLNLLDQTLSSRPRTGGPQVAVLYGTGGVGKTQIALEYARIHQLKYNSVYWIDGRSASTIQSSIEMSVHAINRHYTSHKKHNYHWAEEALKVLRNSKDMMKFMIEWLNYEPNHSWLLILDGVDDLENTDIHRLVSANSLGTVIITTQRLDLANGYVGITVPGLEKDEALTLLEFSSGVQIQADSEESRSAIALVERLAGIPLAINQAGAHIKNRPSSFPITGYLELHRQYPTQFLGKKGSKLPWDRATGTILTTWQLALSSVRSIMPEAAEIVLTSSFLSPTLIMEDLFVAENILSKLQVIEAFEILRKFSLVRDSPAIREINTSSSGVGYVMHSVHHLIARLSMDELKRQSVASRAIRLLVRCADGLHKCDRAQLPDHVSDLVDFYLEFDSNVCEIEMEKFMTSSLIARDSWFARAKLLYVNLMDKAHFYRQFICLFNDQILMGGELSPHEDCLFLDEDWRLMLQLYLYAVPPPKARILLQWIVCRANERYPPEHPIFPTILMLYPALLLEELPMRNSFDEARLWSRWLLKAHIARDEAGTDLLTKAALADVIVTTRPTCVINIVFATKAVKEIPNPAMTIPRLAHVIHYCVPADLGDIPEDILETLLAEMETDQSVGIRKMTGFVLKTPLWIVYSVIQEMKRIAPIHNSSFGVAAISVLLLRHGGEYLKARPDTLDVLAQSLGSLSKLPLYGYIPAGLYDAWIAGIKDVRGSESIDDSITPDDIPIFLMLYCMKFGMDGAIGWPHYLYQTFTEIFEKHWQKSSIWHFVDSLKVIWYGPDYHRLSDEDIYVVERLNRTFQQTEISLRRYLSLIHGDTVSFSRFKLHERDGTNDDVVRKLLQPGLRRAARSNPVIENWLKKEGFYQPETESTMAGSFENWQQHQKCPGLRGLWQAQAAQPFGIPMDNIFESELGKSASIANVEAQNRSRVQTMVDAVLDCLTRLLRSFAVWRYGEPGIAGIHTGEIQQ